MCLLMMPNFEDILLNTRDFSSLQQALSTLRNWSQKWLLSLNNEKCTVVSFGRNTAKCHIYTILDHSNKEVPLERENTMKDLGLWFDDNLSFKQHLHEKITTAFMMLGIIHRNFEHLTIEVASRPTVGRLVRSLADRLSVCFFMFFSYSNVCL